MSAARKKSAPVRARKARGKGKHAARASRMLRVPVALGLTRAASSPLDLRYDRVSFVTVHNTYQRKDAPPDARGFDEYFESLYSKGVRGIELDFAEDDGQWSWSVGHEDAYKSQIELQLAVYLRAMLAWSLKYQPHDPVTIHLEPKSPYREGFVEEFDAYLGDVFSIDPTRVLRPDDVMRDGVKPLDRASQKGQWPTLAGAQNKFLLCITGDGENARAYAATYAASPGRFCFGDHMIYETPGDVMANHDRNRVILNLAASDVGLGPIHPSATRWLELLDELRPYPWLLPRVYYCDLQSSLTEALRRGAWMLATNNPDAFMSYLDHQPFLPRAEAQVPKSSAPTIAMQSRAAATLAAGRTTRRSSGAARAAAARPRPRKRPRAKQTRRS